MRNPTTSLLALALAAAGPACAAATMADELTDLREALSFGKTSATLRYRYERVDQNTFEKEANASTLRVALGYETKPYHGLSVFGQYEGVYLVGDDLYKSPINTKVQYPVVNDPAGSELNQAYIKYTNPSDPWKTTPKLGRQEVLLNNQRLVGNVGWRQNNQTFDGGSISTTPLGGPERSLVATYAYLTAVHRILGEQNPAGRLDMNTQLGNLAYKIPNKVGVAAYALLLKYDDRAAANDNNNSQTFGLRAEGPWKIDGDLSVVYAGEFAKQGDYGNNPNDYDADYYLGELGATYKWAGLKFGYNVLQGASATDKFTTPLATGHAFNGWADIFLNTPNDGLEAGYVTLDIAVPGVNGLAFNGTYYDFRAQTGSAKFGREIDLRLEYKVIPFDKNLLVGLKYADFTGKDLATIGGDPNKDVTKFWAYTQYVF